MRREGVGGEAVFVYDGMGALAMELAANSTGAGISYLTADQLGSTRVVTGQDGAARECFDYLPFGQELNWPCGQSGGTRVRFTGKERDSETGLDYFLARYYSGAQGRFTSADAPLVDQWEQDPQSWNLYSYVRNNPLRFSDPDGRKCVDGVDDKSGHQCIDVVEKMPKPKEEPSGLSPLAPLSYGAAVGHHGLAEWSKIAKDTAAYRFFSKWYTGPLQNPQANYYDALHRALNGATRDIVREFLQSVGKTSLGQLSKEEVKLLARQLLDSKVPGVQEFLTRLERLNPGSVEALAGRINNIKFGTDFFFSVPGQQQLMNYQTCGRSSCGSSGPSF